MSAMFMFFTTFFTYQTSEAFFPFMVGKCEAGERGGIATVP